MENSKHTQGNWEICMNKLIIVKEGTQDIISDCDTTDVETSINLEEMKANTRLIASAPELLEALIDLIECNKQAIENNGGTPHLNKALKAIEKATK